MIRVAVLPGDGIGAEVTHGPLELLQHLSKHGILEVTGPWPVGSSAKATHRSALPAETLAACDDADAVLLGATGLHPGIESELRAEENPLLVLRDRYDLRANIRTVGLPGKANLTIVRNIRGGYFGPPGSRREFSVDERRASDTLILDEPLIAELAELAFTLAQQSSLALVSADKANLWATSRLWRSVVTAVAGARGQSVRHAYIDAVGFEIASDKLAQGVVLTEGIFGDILTDVAAGRAGSIALASSASVNPTGPAIGRCVGLFEPAHGSAPRHTGRATANPTGSYLAIAQLFEWFDQLAHLASGMRLAVQEAYSHGPRPVDMSTPSHPPTDTHSFARHINEIFLRCAIL